MKQNNLAFAEGEPSLFIVQTPFQAMCAINAIRQLKIEKYTLQLHLHKTTEKRNRQTIEIVERYGLKYRIEKNGPVSFFNRLGLLFNRKGCFNRVFLGTHLYQDGYFYALKALRNRGNLVLLDDGIATLALLENGYKVKGRSLLYKACHELAAALRGIKLNNVLTVYKDKNNSKWNVFDKQRGEGKSRSVCTIPRRENGPMKWNVAFNDISLLRQSGLPAEKRDVFFIGTNNSGFIREGIDESGFKQVLYDVLKKVKEFHPTEKITYIPHGRDKSTFAKDFCEEIGIEYMPLDVSIEIHLLASGYIPKAIYGFTSSALYNLKMIFPESDINNFVMRLLIDDNPSMLEASAYYEKQGIPALYV